MIRVTFVGADGTRRTVEAEEGGTLLAAGQAGGQPLEGTCEGQMACATCHVIVDAPDFPRLPPTSEDEEDMLVIATHAARTSRLSCLFVLTAALDGLTVRIPTA